MRQVLVLAVLDVALVDEGLEVAAVLDAVGRVDVDHLHLPGHALLLQQAVHHQQAVAGHQPVAPAAVVLVEVHSLAQRQRLLEPGAEHVAGGSLAGVGLHTLLDDGQDAGRVDALVDVQADGVHLEAGALGLAGPVEVRRGMALELLQRGAHGGFVAAGQRVVDQRFDLGAAHVELQGRVDVRVVGPLRLGLLRIVVRGDHANVGIVAALLVVPVGDDLVVFVGTLGLDLGLCTLGLGQRQARLLRLRGIRTKGLFLHLQGEWRRMVHDPAHRATAALAFG